jgi:predicted DCC family thiol-disulfide oxidoreductase YuxK
VSERAVVLYDEACGFCRWSMAKLLAWDRRKALRPVALQDPEADALLEGMAEDRKMGSFHLVEPGGAVRSGGDALAPLARLLPHGAPVAALATTFPGPTRFAYDLVSRHRARLAKVVGEQACRVDPERVRRGRPDGSPHAA